MTNERMEHAARASASQSTAETLPDRGSPEIASKEKPYEVGYAKPPMHSRFQPGHARNSNEARKSRRPQKPTGNQIEEITGAIIAELNSLMTGSFPQKGPSRHLTGAQAFARMFYKDALAKDGYARKQLFNLYLESKFELDLFKPKDPTAMDADQTAEIIRAIIDPTITAKEVDALIDGIKSAKGVEI